MIILDILVQGAEQLDFLTQQNRCCPSFRSKSSLVIRPGFGNPGRSNAKNVMTSHFTGLFSFYKNSVAAIKPNSFPKTNKNQLDFHKLSFYIN